MSFLSETILKIIENFMFFIKIYESIFDDFSFLFLIYVNDFHNCIAAGDMIMFADDTNIFFTGRNYETIYDCANKQLCNIDH